MKIEMLQTVDDSHKFVVTDANGDPSISYDTRRYEGGKTYDESNGGPDFERRAAGLVKLGYAKEVV